LTRASHRLPNRPRRARPSWLKLTQPVWRTAREQFSLSANIAQEQESTPGVDPYFFLSGTSVESTRSITARLAPEYSFRTEQQYLNVEVTLLHAHLLDYPQEPPLFVCPDQDYFVWRGQLHQLWEIAATPFELEVRANLRRTHAQVSDLHTLGIGGIHSVRVFREDELIGCSPPMPRMSILIFAATRARPALRRDSA
jgi:hemolysin activation/secretion protein